MRKGGEWVEMAPADGRVLEEGVEFEGDVVAGGTEHAEWFSVSKSRYQTVVL